METIWKFLEWIIYLSLMATAILLAKDIIEKFFGQNTGIKQNMEKIKSHPTITICPFLNQCGRPGIPQKIIVKLEGEAEDALSDFDTEGTYIIGSNLVNGKAYWIQESKSQSNAIWYDNKYRNWNIAPIKNLGSTTAALYSPDDSVGPFEATTWKYWKSGWIKSTDIAILIGENLNLIPKPQP